MAIVEGTDLVKDYNDLRAVDHVSFSIDRRNASAFSGPTAPARPR